MTNCLIYANVRLTWLLLQLKLKVEQRKLLLALMMYNLGLLAAVGCRLSVVSCHKSGNTSGQRQKQKQRHSS